MTVSKQRSIKSWKEHVLHLFSRFWLFIYQVGRQNRILWIISYTRIPNVTLLDILFNRIFGFSSTHFRCARSLNHHVLSDVVLCCSKVASLVPYLEAGVSCSTAQQRIWQGFPQYSRVTACFLPICRCLYPFQSLISPFCLQRCRLFFLIVYE